jgi:hypothetical protein
VQFPLVSTRELKGAAEGHCPTSVDDIAGSPQRDCLLVAEHVFDGTLDPWLAPNVQMVVGPRVVTPKPTPTPTPAPTVTPTPHPAQPAVATAKTVKLASLLAHGLTATVTVPTSGATAALRLEQGPRTLAKATKRHLKAGTVKVHLLLSQAGRAKLRHAKAAHLTLVAKIGAKTLKVPVLAKR